MAAVTLRARVRGLLESDPSSPASILVDRFIVALILLNVAAVVFESMDHARRFDGALRVFELVSLVVFSVEYLLRLWSIVEEPRFSRPFVGRLRWMMTPAALVDLAAIAPAFFLRTDLRFVRLLRLLRVLKLTRYSESFRVLGNVFRARREELTSSLLIVMVTLVLASSFMYYAEREAQPDVFTSIPAAMWWGIITLTTIGYGDAYPVTALGKLLGGVAALAGILVLALPVGILASGFTEEMAARHRRAAETVAAAAAPAVCPHCGGSLAPRKP